MADKNFNQGNQSGQDWERERNRNKQESGWSQSRNRGQGRENINYSGNQDRNMDQGYRDVGYSGDSVRGMGNDYEENYNRVNYFPDNDDNRDFNDRDYENTQFGSSGTYGYKGADNSGGYNREERDYGNNYGNRYGNESEWQRRHSQQTGAGNWGSDYGRQDWGRSNVNTERYGNRQDREQRSYSTDHGYMNNDYDRNRVRNRYGGDTSNHGNANQGGTDGNWWDRTKDKVSSWFSDDDDRNRSRDYGGHRGKGPSDYRRSQERIREDICDRLTDDDRVDASHVRIQIENDVVILSGTVNSREEKRRAEDLVESISGVRDVENRLHVGRSDLSSRDYTGNTNDVSGIGSESGTTNEIIRNTGSERSPGTDKSKNKNP